MGKWEWFGQAGHFCCADRCHFHLHTHVNGFCISTVGEFLRKPTDRKFTTLGAAEHLYETMVFKVRDDGSIGLSERQVETYNDRDEARDGHIRLCRKYARKKVTNGTA